jgi:acetyl esterase
MDADSIAFMAMQPPPPSVPPTPGVARENLRRKRLVNQPDLPQVARVMEYQAAGPAGPIALRAYRGAGAGTAAADALPVQVYYHGGGWVIGDLDSHD